MVSLPNIVFDVRLSEIASFLRLSYIGEDVHLDGFNLSNRIIEANSVISYCAAPKFFRKAKKNSKVKALIVSQSFFDEMLDEDKKLFSFIISETAEWTFYEAFIEFSNRANLKAQYQTIIPDDAIIHEGAVVEEGVVLGHNVEIGCNSVIKAGTIIENNVMIGCCSVIGGEGFQLIKDDKGICHTIPHVGRTYLGNNVTVGDNTVVTKSLFEGYTMVMDDAKIDNFVHISHNCFVGNNSVVTGHAAMMGSCSLGKNVWIAPNSTIMNKIHIGDGAFVCACSFVCVDVKPGIKVGGNPAQRIKEY